MRILWLVATFLLTGCLVLVPGPAVGNFVFESSWVRRDNRQPVICDNKVTQYAYSFSYSSLSDIVDWSETYRGLVSGQVEGPFRRTLSDAVVDTSAKRITVVLQFDSRFKAPLSISPTVGRQAISVVPIDPPPAVTGRTQLEVRVGLNDGTAVRSEFVYPVYSNC